MDKALEAASDAKAKAQQEISRQKAIIADAETRLARAQAEAAELDEWIAKWYRLTGTPAFPKAAERIETKRLGRPKNPDRELVVEAVIGLIRQHGHPLPRRELFDMLQAQGITIRGKDPEMVLSTMLWRSKDKVVRLPKHGYWLADEAFLDAWYDPRIDAVLGVAAREPEDGVEADDVE